MVESKYISTNDRALKERMLIWINLEECLYKIYFIVINTISSVAEMTLNINYVLNNSKSLGCFHFPPSTVHSFGSPSDTGASVIVPVGAVHE